MPGTLYLCATPIGNLGDITLRVLDTLREADLIAAEDTRNTLRLLNHFEIKKPMTSYHEHNKYEKARELLDRLHRGENIALVTDAGTPAISDPGEVLAALCIEEGIRVTSLPGACALITASPCRACPPGVLFEGFLPLKKERKRILDQLRDEERTTILYEAPHHLRATLAELAETLGSRRITLCRELTKRFEEAMPLTQPESVRYYEENEPRGEYVLVIEVADPARIIEKKQAVFEEMPWKSTCSNILIRAFPRKKPCAESLPTEVSAGGTFTSA